MWSLPWLKSCGSLERSSSMSWRAGYHTEHLAIQDLSPLYPLGQAKRTLPLLQIGKEKFQPRVSGSCQAAPWATMRLPDLSTWGRAPSKPAKGKAGDSQGKERNCSPAWDPLRGQQIRYLPSGGGGGTRRAPRPSLSPPANSQVLGKMLPLVRPQILCVIVHLTEKTTESNQGEGMH